MHVSNMSEIVCFYCQRKFKAKSDYSARQALNSHMRRCPVRKGGIRYPVGGSIFVVRPHSPAVIGRLNNLVRDVASLEPQIQKAIFVGFLECEQHHKKIFEFRVEDPPSTA